MSDELGPIDQYFGKDRKLFPWEREHRVTSLTGAEVVFHRDDVRQTDGYVKIRRGGQTTVIDTRDFVAAVRALFLE